MKKVSERISKSRVVSERLWSERSNVKESVCEW